MDLHGRSLPDPELDHALSAVTDIVCVESGCYESFPCQHRVRFVVAGAAERCTLVHAPIIWAALARLGFPFVSSTTGERIMERHTLQHLMVEARSTQEFELAQANWLRLFGQVPTQLTVRPTRSTTAEMARDPSVTLMMDNQVRSATNTREDFVALQVAGETSGRFQPLIVSAPRTLAALFIEHRPDRPWSELRITLQNQVLMRVYPEVMDDSGGAHSIALQPKISLPGTPERPLEVSVELTTPYLLTPTTSDLAPNTSDLVPNTPSPDVTPTTLLPRVFFKVWREEPAPGARAPHRVILPTYSSYQPFYTRFALSDDGAGGSTCVMAQEDLVRAVLVPKRAVQPSVDGLDGSGGLDGLDGWVGCSVWLAWTGEAGEEEESQEYPVFCLETQGECLRVPLCACKHSDMLTPMGRGVSAGDTLTVRVSRNGGGGTATHLKVSHVFLESSCMFNLSTGCDQPFRKPRHIT